jgi:hypothetical protein
LELTHPQDVLENERTRAEFSQQADELSVEAIARIVDEAIMIAHLAVRLAGGATRKQIEGTRSNHTEKFFVLLGPRQVSFDQSRGPKVCAKGCVCVGVVVCGSDDPHSSVFQPLAETPCAAKKIDRSEFRLPVHTP